MRGGRTRRLGRGSGFLCCGLGWCQHPVWLLESGWEGKEREVHTTSRCSSPIDNQNAPHIVFITDTTVSRALNPINPAMNCARPPQIATKWKNMSGESSLPHQLAIHDAVMKASLRSRRDRALLGEQWA